MSDTFERFKAEISDEACLDALMQVQHGGTRLTCPACRRSAQFLPVARTRSCRCGSCGHGIHPCKNTPFADPGAPLTHWFLAASLMTGNRHGVEARELQSRIGCTYKAAWHMERGLRKHLAHGVEQGPKAAWVEAVEALARSRAPDLDDRSADATTVAPRQARHGGILRAGRERIAVGAVAGIRGTRLAHVVACCAIVLAVLAGAFAAMVGGEDEEAPAPTMPTLTLGPPKPSVTLALGDEIGNDDLRDAIAASSIRLGPAPYKALAKELAAPGPRNPEEILTFGPMKIRRHLVETIVRAARVTNADPVLLMAIADKESSFATEVRAKTSSATGLFQFIEKTWLRVVRDFGARHGLAKEASAIVSIDNELTVADAAERARILELRRDPYLSALLAAEMLKRDTTRIAGRIGRDLTHGETYIVHFLGPNGAERFLEKVDEEPNLAAAVLLPKPAQANKPIFFRQDGPKAESLSVAEVHRNFEAMMGLRLERYRKVPQLWGPLGGTRSVRAGPGPICGPAGLIACLHPPGPRRLVIGEGA